MDIEEICEHLGTEYAHKGYSEAWTHEGPKLRSTLNSFVKQYGNLYKLTEALSLGGSGIALAAEFIPLGNEPQVIKFPRPVLGQEEALNQTIAKETEKLRTLRHQNIIRITFQGEVEGLEATQFYAMEYLEGVRDADDYLLHLMDVHSSTVNLIEIVQGSLSGLSYLHDNGIVHLDLKPANLFVNTKGKVVVADFGFAKKFASSGQTANIGGTDGYMHPAYAQLMARTSDPNRNQGGITLRDQLQPIWDLYSLGQTYLRLLEITDKRDPKGASDYQRQYIRLMAYRMLDGNFPSGPLPNGLPRAVFTATSYNDVHDVLVDLGKLTGTHNLAVRVPEISRYQKHTIQAASHGPVPFTPRVEKLIDSPEVRRLGQLPQLGLVQFIYPTATHSRLEHSLGTFAMACRYIRSLYNDPFNPLFRQIVTDRDIEALLVAALVHDVGHYPLAHDLEEAEEDVFGHERRTLEILHNINSEVSSVINFKNGATTEEHWTITVGDVTAILDRTTTGIKSQVLRSCLDGPIDADKLDYLLRDSENLRLPYGRGIDVEKLIQSLTVIAEIKLGKTTARVGIHERGKIAAESLAFARYAMYGSVYWHHAHRSAKSMLNALAFEALHQAEQADRTSKAGYKKTLREELYRFLSAVVNDQTELALLARAPHDNGAAFLDRGSEDLIHWLDERGKLKAHSLANSLISRDLFKRALVISRVHDGAFDWSAVEDVYGHLGRNWRIRRRINEILQGFVVDQLQSSTPGASSALSANNVTRAIAASTEGPVILVDYPPDKTGVLHGSSLDYLREGALRRGDGNDTGIEGLEQSPVWRSLRNDSRRSLAKLRVFCHPLLQAPISAAISRPDFEKAIRDAITQAQQDVR